MALPMAFLFRENGLRVSYTGDTKPFCKDTGRQ